MSALDADLPVDLSSRRAAAARRRGLAGRRPSANVLALLHRRAMAHPQTDGPLATGCALAEWLRAASIDDGMNQAEEEESDASRASPRSRSLGLRECDVRTFTDHATVQEAIDATLAPDDRRTSEYQQTTHPHQQPPPPPQPEAHGRKSTLCMAQSPTGDEIASGHSDHTIRVWSLCAADSRLVWTLPGHSRTPCTVAYHPVLGHLLASGDLAGVVCLWCTHRGVRLASYDFGRPGVGRTMERIASLSWYPSREQLCLAIAHRKLCFFWMMHAEEEEEEEAVNINRQVEEEEEEPTEAAEAQGVGEEQKMNLDTNDAPQPGRKRPREAAPAARSNGVDVTRSVRKRSRLFDSTSLHERCPARSASASPSALSSWVALADHLRTTLQHISDASPSHTPGKPIPMMKAALAWRYVHFHANGEYLLLAERMASANPAAAAAASGPGVGVGVGVDATGGYDRNSLALRVYSLDPSRFVLHSASRKQEMLALAVLTRLLFFSESGIAVNQDRIATCQWTDPPSTTIGVPVAGVARPVHCASSGDLVPTLAVFDLRVGHVGEVLMRLELNVYSFADLTCVAFSPDAGTYLAVAYQIRTSERAKRRQMRTERDRQEMDQGQGRGGPAGTSERSDTAPVGRRRLPVGGRSRFSALTTLTRDEQPSMEMMTPAAGGTNERDTTTATGASSTDGSTCAPASSVSAISTFSFASLPLTRYRPSSSYASLAAQVVEDHTFLSVYRSSDLALVRQLTVDGCAATAHSVNALIFSAQPTVGILAGVTNGDILVCAPIVRENQTDDTPVADAAAVASSSSSSSWQRQVRPTSIELDGRHRLAPYVRRQLVARPSDSPSDEGEEL